MSAQPLTLTVESPAENAPDLTLIDLPGIPTKTSGKHPCDIDDKIKNIIMRYIEIENALIMCVISADHDLIESIRIAKEVDPQGHRTFGRFTLRNYLK